MGNSIKSFLLESESDRDKNFAYLDSGSISKVCDIDFSQKQNFVRIEFLTIYNKKFSLLVKLDDFKKWLKSKVNGKHSELFYDFLIDFFNNSKESDIEKINEIVDDTNEIIPDDDMPSNATNRMVGANQTMDSEKVFNKSMPKSVRNYSGNLGLGTVVW